MFKNAVAFAAKLLRRHRHAHLDVLDFPLCPCTAVHPDAAVVEPLRTSLLLEVDGSHDGIGTLAVSAVWVGEVAGYVYLVRFNLLKQFANDVHIRLAHRQLFNLARLIERQVEEVDVVERYTVVCAGGACLATAYESLDGAHLRSVHIARLLLSEEVLDVAVHLLYHLVLVVAEELVVAVHEVHEACHLLVADSNVARCLVGDVHVVVLLNESTDCAAHRDYVVVGVRREYYHALLCWQCALRAVGVVGVRFAARPAGDGVLQVVEYLYVAVVSRAKEGEQVRESVLVIVLVGELEDWLLHELAEPNHCGAYRLVGPLAVGHEPRVNDAC